jgi:hypothetical protein
VKRQAVRVLRALKRLARALIEPFVVVGVASAVEVGLRFWTLPRLARLLGVPLDLDRTEPATRPVVLPRRTAWSMRVVDGVMRRWPWGDTCLRRSLVTGHRLRDLAPVLRLGVRDAARDRPDAHAWLELQDGSLDSTASRFAPLVRGGHT